MVQNDLYRQANAQADLLALVGGGLRKVAGSQGGEYAGPCPVCGGTDRFHVQPQAEPPPWLCRHCSGGRWRRAVDLVMLLKGVGAREAAKRLKKETPLQLPPFSRTKMGGEEEGEAAKRLNSKGAGLQNGQENGGGAGFRRARGSSSCTLTRPYDEETRRAGDRPEAEEQGRLAAGAKRALRGLPEDDGGAAGLPGLWMGGKVPGGEGQPLGRDFQRRGAGPWAAGCALRRGRVRLYQRLAGRA